MMLLLHAMCAASCGTLQPDCQIGWPQPCSCLASAELVQKLADIQAVNAPLALQARLALLCQPLHCSVGKVYKILQVVPLHQLAFILL